MSDEFKFFIIGSIMGFTITSLYVVAFLRVLLLWMGRIEDKVEFIMVSTRPQLPEQIENGDEFARRPDRKNRTMWD